MSSQLRARICIGYKTEMKKSTILMLVSNVESIVTKAITKKHTTKIYVYSWTSVHVCEGIRSVYAD